MIPRLHLFKQKGGTFYTFPSASHDLSRCFMSSDYNFKFSKCALLKLPEICTPANQDIFSAIIPPHVATPNSDDNKEKILVCNLQNYVMMLDHLMLRDLTKLDDTSIDHSNSNTLKTPAERILFNWMAKMGYISFKPDSSSVSSAFKSGEYYTETAASKDRLIQYIGDIDVTNNVDINDMAYTEVYIHVPTLVGSTPKVIFNKDVTNRFLLDTPLSFDSLKEPGIYNPGKWTAEDENISNLPYIDPGFSYRNDKLDITQSMSEYTYTVKDTDPSGIMSIEWDPNVYSDIDKDPDLSTIMDYNGSADAADFEFNAVLVYYEIQHGDAKMNNLYGILFLDQIQGGKIATLPKYKFDSTVGVNGNSFGVKLNIRLDSHPGESTIETIVNEYNTMSMDLFNECMARLKAFILSLREKDEDIAALEMRLGEVEAALEGNVELDELADRLGALESTVANYLKALDDSDSLVDMIANLNRQIQQLMNGETPIEVMFNTDVLMAGPGIALTKVSEQNKIRIDNINQAFDFNGGHTFGTQNFTTAYNHILKPFTNYVYINNTSVQGIYSVNIDTSESKFEVGQMVRIQFSQASRLKGGISFTVGSTALTTKVTQSDIQCENPIIEIVRYGTKDTDYHVNVINLSYNDDVANGSSADALIKRLSSYNSFVTELNAGLIAGYIYVFPYSLVIEGSWSKGKATNRYSCDIYLKALDDKTYDHNAILHVVDRGTSYDLPCEYYHEMDNAAVTLGNGYITYLKDWNGNEANYDFLNYLPEGMDLEIPISEETKFINSKDDAARRTNFKFPTGVVVQAIEGYNNSVSGIKFDGINNNGYIFTLPSIVIKGDDNTIEGSDNIYISGNSNTVRKSYDIYIDEQSENNIVECSRESAIVGASRSNTMISSEEIRIEGTSNSIFHNNYSTLLKHVDNYTCVPNSQESTIVISSDPNFTYRLNPSILEMVGPKPCIYVPQTVINSDDYRSVMAVQYKAYNVVMGGATSMNTDNANTIIYERVIRGCSDSGVIDESTYKIKYSDTNRIKLS